MKKLLFIFTGICLEKGQQEERKLAICHTDDMECAETEAVGLFGSLSPLAYRPLPLILPIVS